MSSQAHQGWMGRDKLVEGRGCCRPDLLPYTVHHVVKHKTKNENEKRHPTPDPWHKK